MNYSIDWKTVQKQYHQGWVSPKYAAIILGCSPKIVRSLMDKGEISLLERNPWRKVTLNELKRFADSMGIKDASDYSDEKEKQSSRFWLRMELYKMHYAWHRDEMEEAFQWIYDAPLKDWKNMVECLRQADLIKDDHLEGTFLERGKQLFSFLS